MIPSPFAPGEGSGLRPRRAQRGGGRVGIPRDGEGLDATVLRSRRGWTSFGVKGLPLERHVVLRPKKKKTAAEELTARGGGERRSPGSGQIGRGERVSFIDFPPLPTPRKRARGRGSAIFDIACRHDPPRPGRGDSGTTDSHDGSFRDARRRFGRPRRRRPMRKAKGAVGDRGVSRPRVEVVRLWPMMS